MRRNENAGKKKGKKRLKIALSIIGGVVVTAVLVITGIAMNNIKAMNGCIDAALAELEKKYVLTPCDTGDYKEMKIMGPIKFHVEQYDIEEVGNLSVMRVNMGIMQMATLVITPTEKNLPLLSADYMYILSNRKCYLEFYDVVREKEELYEQLLNALADTQKNYEYLENIETTPAWYAPLLTVTSYKAGSVKEDKELQNMLVDSIEIYLEHSKNFPLLSTEEKEEKVAITQEYTDGLIEKGGISTDVFKNAMGAEETKKFFDNVFFGTK